MSQQQHDENGNSVSVPNDVQDMRSIIREEVQAILKERVMGSIDELSAALTRYIMVQNRLQSGLRPMEFK